MRFKNFELYVDNRVFDSSDMKQIVSADADYFQHNKEIYLIDKKIIDERFLWIYCQFDNEKEIESEQEIFIKCKRLRIKQLEGVVL